ncbi:MAG: nucleotidyltransferase domain-containing protein [Clostridia bacterium]|nr:nucleotidyltransferase domain-containing protein [Clostridia bacterium]
MSDHIYTVDEIREIVAPIASRHGISRVYLFGSYAKGAATTTSDVDLCVDASKLRGLFALSGLYLDLQEALQKDLDLITTNSLKRNKDAAFLANLRKEQVLIYAGN